MLPQWTTAADRDSDLESVEGLVSSEEKTYYASFKERYGHHLDSLRRALSRRTTRILVGAGILLLLFVIVVVNTDWHHVKTKVHELTAEEKPVETITKPIGEAPKVSSVASISQQTPASAAPEPSLDINVWPVQVPSNIKSIQNATLGFEKILVINLPSRTDKKDRMTLGAAVSNMSLEFVDGVLGADMSEKSFPYSTGTKALEKSYLGSWRAHMNALRTVVAQNLSSALIMEDDIDWDIRIHDQLEAFAVGSRYVLDQTVYESHDSPYGEGWDLFWLGHCSERGVIPNTRIFDLPNDPTTVNLKNYHDNWAKGTMKDWKDHSRKVYFSENPICTYSYAVSQKGARKLLWYMDIKEVKENYDIDLANWCNKKKRPDAMCLTTAPPYFVAHKPRGNAAKLSDNSPEEDRKIEHSFTFNIRLSVMNNLEKLVEGDPMLTDYYPDDVQAGSVTNPYR